MKGQPYTDRMTRTIGHSSTLAIGGVSSPLDSFVVAESSVLHTTFCAEKPAHRQSAKRSLPCMVFAGLSGIIEKMAFGANRNTFFNFWVPQCGKQETMVRISSEFLNHMNALLPGPIFGEDPFRNKLLRPKRCGLNLELEFLARKLPGK